MRMMITANVPNEAGNAAIKNGTMGSTIQRILEQLKPEAAYFTAINGQRTAILFVDVPNSSDIPRFAEPFFLEYGCDVEILPVMSAEDLGKANLGAFAG